MKNFLKYFKFIFYRLVSKKMLLTIILGLLFFILFNNSSAFAVVNHYDPTIVETTTYAVIDTEESFLNHYDNIMNTFLSHAYYRWRNFNDPTFLSIMANENSEGNQIKYPYVYATADYIDFILYRPIAVDSSDITDWFGGRYSYVTPAYAINKEISRIEVYRYDLGSGLFYNITNDPNFDIGIKYVPFVIWGQFSPTYSYWRSRFEDSLDNTQDNNDLYNKLDEILTALGQQNSNAILNDIKENTQATAEAVEEIKDVIKDTNIDNNLSSSLPSDNTQDITNEGINNIFSFLQDSFTSGTPKDIVIPVPFTGKSFVIQANFLQNILAGTDFEWLSNIIQLFWWYIISVFIVKDISQKFTKIKSGNVENIQDNNIKEEML